MVWVLLLLIFAAPSVSAREPSVREVQEEAVRFLGYDQSRIDGWDKKAKLAAALPRLQFGFQRDLKDTVSLTTRDNVSISDGNVLIGPDENNFDQNFNQGTVVGVKAYWALDQLVFNREMLAVSAERRNWVRERDRVLREVTEAYFTRTRLIQEIRKKSDPLPIREKKKLMLDKAAAVIDAGTGGWFSDQLGGIP